MGVEGLRCDECVEGFYGLSTDGCQGKLNSKNHVFFALFFSRNYVSEFKRTHISLSISITLSVSAIKPEFSLFELIKPTNLYRLHKPTVL